MIHLNQYTVGDYSPGAPLWKQLLWFFIGDAIVRSRLLPMSALKVWVLRSFGASIGKGVRIKPDVQVKFPWRLTIGDHCWVGESAWFDNVAPIVVESHVCISQSVYLCTGNHDWSHPQFTLKPAEIYIQSGSWLAAKSVVGPGVTIGQGAILCLGSVTGRSLDPLMVYAGNPAVVIKERKINASSITSTVV